jgi:hypothetical protein
MALQQPPNAIIALRQQPVRATPSAGNYLKRTRDLYMAEAILLIITKKKKRWYYHNTYTLTDL